MKQYSFIELSHFCEQQLTDIERSFRSESATRMQRKYMQIGRILFMQKRLIEEDTQIDEKIKSDPG